MNNLLKRNHLIVIGSSAGGPRVLKEIFSGLPLINGSIILIQHMPKYINETLTDNLNECTDMSVEIAQDGVEVESGNIYVAPSEIHLKLIDNKKIHLSDGEKVNFARPSIDVTFESIQITIGIKLVGIILTGMGNDGAKGIKHIKSLGGLTIVQDKETSVIDSMPKAAIDTGAVDLILTPSQIREKLIELAGI
ncbi:chemotaxis protein CheB [bacterium]|nr:chemotaxis protein CheB [bacterium]RQV95541.1 MAG: chemotaxis protein CheB [bacterium]